VATCNGFNGLKKASVKNKVVSFSKKNVRFDNNSLIDDTEYRGWKLKKYKVEPKTINKHLRLCDWVRCARTDKFFRNSIFEKKREVQW